MANANSVIKQSVLAYLGNADDPEISNPIHSTELAA